MDKPDSDDYNEGPGGVRMTDVADLLDRWREDPEISEVLRTFAEVDRLYREVILTAHGSETTIVTPLRY